MHSFLSTLEDARVTRITPYLYIDRSSKLTITLFFYEGHNSNFVRSIDDFDENAKSMKTSIVVAEDLDNPHFHGYVDFRLDARIPKGDYTVFILRSDESGSGQSIGWVHENETPIARDQEILGSALSMPKDLRFTGYQRD